MISAFITVVALALYGQAFGQTCPDGVSVAQSSLCNTGDNGRSTLYILMNGLCCPSCRKLQQLKRNTPAEPSCSRPGRDWLPVQCLVNNCRCVTIYGQEIPGTSFVRGSTERNCDLERARFGQGTSGNRCMDGTLSSRSCSSNLQCNSQTESCYNGYCCMRTSIGCPAGQVSGGQCSGSNNFCPSGYSCNFASNLCCSTASSNSCPAGQRSSGYCINRQCPAGYSCDIPSNLCCTSGVSSSFCPLNTTPYYISNGPVRCTIGASNQCPSSFVCNRQPGNTQAYCCSTSQSGSTCPDGSFSSRTCSFNSQCNIQIEDCISGRCCRRATGSTCPDGTFSSRTCSFSSQCNSQTEDCINGRCCRRATGSTCPDGSFSSRTCSFNNQCNIQIEDCINGRCCRRSSINSVCPAGYNAQMLNGASVSCVAGQNTCQLPYACMYSSVSQTYKCCSASSVSNDPICSMPRDDGLCFNGATGQRSSRYYYNPLTRQCSSFLFSGCGGNSNNFITLSECQRRCLNNGGSNNLICGINERLDNCGNRGCEPTCSNRNPFCTQQCDRPACVCASGFARQNNVCIPLSSCTNFNSNNLRCQQPLATGNTCFGTRSQTKYYFNGSRCMSFTYLGCNGNQNQFNSLSECEQVCRFRLAQEANSVSSDNNEAEGVEITTTTEAAS